MTNLCIIDIDGVVLNNDHREQKANAIVESAIQQVKTYLDAKQLEQVQKSIFYHPSVFYAPDLLETDTLINGAREVINELDTPNTNIVFLTSRPEWLREITLKTLLYHDAMRPTRSLVMKPMSAQFTKTVTWKASMIDTLAMFFHSTHADVIDDDKSVRDEVLQYLDPNRYTINVYASLQEALKDRI